MLNKRTVQIHDIGEVSLVKSLRARNINISVRSSKEVRVAVPVGTPFLVAENFANKKKGWILKKISEISAKKRLSLKDGEDHSKKERKISEHVSKKLTTLNEAINRGMQADADLVNAVREFGLCRDIGKHKPSTTE